jgi:hypothetical protein
MEIVAPYPVIILLTCVGERPRPVVGPREVGRKYSSSLSDFTALPQSDSLGLAPLHTVAQRLSAECGPRSFADRCHLLVDASVFKSRCSSAGEVTRLWGWTDISDLCEAEADIIPRLCVQSGHGAHQLDVQ